jgi:pyruvate dehydrogenase E2 component (dihydrolipoamide acetyltransferase)
VLAVLAEEGENVEAAASAPTSAAPAAAPAARNGAAQPAPAAAVAPSVRGEVVADVEAYEPEGARARVSPVARRMAQEMGIDLSQVAGSGPGGRVIKRDILVAAENRGAAAPAARSAPAQGLVAAAPSAAPAPAASAAGAIVPGVQSVEVPVSNMRGVIARRLVESKQQVPHYQVTMKFAMDALIKLRGELNEQLSSMDVKLSVNDFIIRACALAMARNAFFNASWAGDRILVHQQVNVGVAIALPKGLSMEEMSGATFTISNLGMFGVDNFTAIINPPNSAILACGAAIEQPVVRNHQLCVGWEMAATLSLDHRVIDGAMAAKYLQSLKQFVESPTLLLV